MPENLTRQILREHLVEGDLTPGRPIALKVDQTLLQDATGTMSLMQFEQLEVPRVKVDRAVQYVDHNVIKARLQEPRRPPHAAGPVQHVRGPLLAPRQRHLP